MKDPLSSRRKRPKMRVVVSFNGAFRQFPPSGNLRYVGGETRIVSVDRPASLSELVHVVSELMILRKGDAALPGPFSLVCRLSEKEEERPLVLLSSDDNVRCMTEAYEKLLKQGKLARLWVYVTSIEQIGRNYEPDDRTGIPVFYNGSGDFTNGGFVNSQFQDHFGHANRNPNFGVLLYRVNTNDDSYRNRGSIGTNSLGKILPTPLPNSGHLNSNICVRMEDCSINGLSVNEGNYTVSGNWVQTVQRPGSLKPRCNSEDQALMTDLYRENVMPYDVNSNMVSNVYDVNNNMVRNVYARPPLINSLAGSPCGLIRHRRLGSGERRNHRIGPYQFRVQGNGNETGNYHNLRLDSRPWLGKVSIVWQQDPSLCMPQSDSHHEVVEKPEMIENHVSNQVDSSDIPYYRHQNLTELVDDAIPAQENESLNVLLQSGAACTKVDPLTCPISESRQAQHHATGKDTFNMDVVNEAVHIMSQNRSETTSSGKKEIADIVTGCEIFNDHQNSTPPALVGITLPMHQLIVSLSDSTSTKEEHPAIFPTRSDISEAFLKPKSKHQKLMTEEHLSSVSVSHGEGTGECASGSSIAADPEKAKENEHDKKIQLELQYNLRISEKKGEGTSKSCIKMFHGIPANVATFYRVVNAELQSIKYSDLEFTKELGSGTYGTVYHGKWRGSDVAIKRIKASCLNGDAKEKDRLILEFWKEARLLGQLHHPNIVELYGVVTDGPPDSLAAVTEYMVNGSLKQVLRKKDRTIDRRKRLIIAMDAAFAMEYLHGKKIVHFDLKSHNFLVNMKDPLRPVCKIGDLGLSKVKQRTLVSGGVRGTIPWMAPELLNGEKMVTEKVDVYSFGVVMWELLTGEEPYADMRSEQILYGLIEGSLRPETPNWCDPAWKSLMEKCWSADPDARPAFSEIAKELRAMAAAMNIK